MLRITCRGLGSGRGPEWRVNGEIIKRLNGGAGWLTFGMDKERNDGREKVESLVS